MGADGKWKEVDKLTEVGEANLQNDWGPIWTLWISIFEALILLFQQKHRISEDKSNIATRSEATQEHTSHCLPETARIDYGNCVLLVIVNFSMFQAFKVRTSLKNTLIGVLIKPSTVSIFQRLHNQVGLFHCIKPPSSIVHFPGDCVLPAELVRPRRLPAAAFQHQPHHSRAHPRASHLCIRLFGARIYIISISKQKRNGTMIISLSKLAILEISSILPKANSFLSQFNYLWSALGSFWWSMNENVLRFSYGFSSGAPSERGIYQDVRAVYEYILRQRPNCKVCSVASLTCTHRLLISSSQIILMGYSIGTTAVIDMASARPPNLAGIVLLAPFMSGLRLIRQTPDEAETTTCCLDPFKRSACDDSLWQMAENREFGQFWTKCA